MKKTLIKIRSAVVHVLVLLLIFVGSVAGFEHWLNQSSPNTAEGMESSTFPLLYMRNDEVSYNCLHGYANEMDASYIRDTITVLGSDHLLDIQIQPFSMSVDSISYEVLTSDGKQSLENTNVVKTTQENGYIYATLEIQNNMLMNEEYILKVKLTAGGREIYFYTRLILEDGLHLSGYLDFVTGFYEKCVNQSEETLGTYVEPDATSGQSTTLAAMDIHDTVNQLMWGDLNPQIYYKPTPSLVDINETTASFVLEYRISTIGEGGVTEIYNIEEFYRLRYTDTRIFLLDFTRTTDEVFQTDKDVIESNGINLGITGMDVEYQFNEKKKVVAFVQENELWTYNISGDKLTRVFGFPQSENMDYRDFYDKNTIKILRVESDGSVWFTVSGYMNRGKHEGENGIGLYYYEEASATVDEKVFIDSVEAYDMLKLDVGTLAYVTDNGQYFYVLLEGAVYRVALETGQCEQIIGGVMNNCYESSSSNQYFAWLLEGKEYDSGTLCVIDLETGETREITGSENERLRPVAFMGEDLVYGAAYLSDIDTAHEGSEVFPMYRLTIIDSEGEQIKNYQPDGYYVTDVEGTENMLTMTRVVRGESGFEEASEDHIVSTDVEDDVIYGISTKTSSTRQTEILLRFGTTVSSSNPQVVTSKMLASESAKEIYIPANEEREALYYVYAGGSMTNRYTSAAPAICEADESVGVVINEKKQFVWERGNRSTTKKIKVEKVPDAFRSGLIDTAALQEAMGEDYTVLDLTGCTLDMVLYFVGQGRSVQAMTPDGVVTITGYDEYNVILLDPGSDETYYGGLQDSTALFEEAGCQFVSYIEN
jgi:hypothetical protein